MSADDTQWWLHYAAEDFYEPNLVDKSVFVLTRIGGFLSLLAALTILGETYGDQGIVPSTLFVYQFPILMQSMGEVVGSWALPKHTPARWGALGNFTTCTVQGFFVVGGNTSQLFFDLFLSLLFYLLVKSNYSMATLRRLQRCFFLFVFCTTSVATIVPLFYELYNPNWTSCGVNSIPIGCKRSECYRGGYAFVYLNVYMTIPIVTVCFSCFVMHRIYNHILQTSQAIEESAHQVALKGLLYASTYVVAILPTIVAVIFNVFFKFWNRYYICFALTLFNLYGFLNLLVFLYGRKEMKTQWGRCVAYALGYAAGQSTIEAARESPKPTEAEDDNHVSLEG